MKNYKKLFISKNTSIFKALKIISDGKIKLAIIVDNKDRLLGTITDGDIRRGILNGMKLNDPILSIYNPNPIFSKGDQSSEELVKIALSNDIYQIPIVDNDLRVIDIIFFGDLIKKKKKKNFVFILAGGLGSRLMPLTKDIPKPMLDIGSKPILQIIIESFREQGFINFKIFVNYKSHVIKNFFLDGKKFGVNIKYIEEKKRLGTAGPLALVDKTPTNPFFVINADVITNLNYGSMLEFHKKNNSKATMCTHRQSFELPYGEVEIFNENIKSIEEKPTYFFSVNTGIYILNPEILTHIPKKFYNMTTLFNKLIEKKLKVISFPLQEYWLDIGTKESYQKVNKDFSLLPEDI